MVTISEGILKKKFNGPTWLTLLHIKYVLFYEILRTSSKRLMSVISEILVGVANCVLISKAGNSLDSLYITLKFSM